MSSPNDHISGGPRIRQIPEGDTVERLVCPECNFINYENPLIVAGAVISSGEKILLCRRAIEPRHGYWTIPAGYMALGETPAEAAAREALEEACAKIDINALLAVYTIPRISQVQFIYRARIARPVFDVGEESMEVALFDWAEIPWDELAFPTVHWALQHYQQSKARKDFAPFANMEVPSVV